MTTIQVNFSAALVVSLLAIGCGPTNSTPRTADSTPAREAAAVAAAQQSAPADPIVAAADRGRILGDSSAKTWIIIASDFQCPFCKTWHDQTHRSLVDEYVRTGKVKVAYINFPLSQHRNAMITAEASMCAGAQAKFWEYHDALFATQQQWAALSDAGPVLDSIASRVGVDVPEWKQCVRSGKMRPSIENDRDRLEAAGVRSTPSFLIGDLVLLGTQPMEALRPALDAALAKGGTTPR